MSYYPFIEETEEQGAYGSFQTLYLDTEDCKGWNEKHQTEEQTDEDDTPYLVGYYWQAGFPGCMPDSEYPSGPFQTEDEAIQDARNTDD